MWPKMDESVLQILWLGLIQELPSVNMWFSNDLKIQLAVALLPLEPPPTSVAGAPPESKTLPSISWEGQGFSLLPFLPANSLVVRASVL